MMASEGELVKLAGESAADETEELRVGGDRDGVLDAAREDGVR
jgi:hypothetical protein